MLNSSPPNFVDLSNQQFGLLTVYGRIGRNRQGSVVWFCLCECGNVREVSSWLLRRPKKPTRNCGCETPRHYMSFSRTYQSWHGMKTRCENPNDDHYPSYGARGIKICERWRSSFKAFFADMGERPAGKTIERINNDGDYEPSNCCWATPREQSNNRRRTPMISFKGRTQSLSDWSRELGINYNTLYSRIAHSKWSVERALTAPVN